MWNQICAFDMACAGKVGAETASIRTLLWVVMRRASCWWQIACWELVDLVEKSHIHRLDTTHLAIKTGHGTVSAWTVSFSL